MKEKTVKGREGQRPLYKQIDYIFSLLKVTTWLSSSLLKEQIYKFIFSIFNKKSIRDIQSFTKVP